MLRPDRHVTVTLYRLRDDRFPGWVFEIRREPHVFFAVATKGATVCTSTGYVLAADAFDAVRAKLEASQANRLGVDLESLRDCRVPNCGRLVGDCPHVAGQWEKDMESL